MAEDYEVGYGKPPKHTRFKPGVSGNPGGRPAGTRGLKTDLAAEAKARHTISIGGKAVSGSRQQLALRTLAIRAASGDLKAVQLMLSTIIQVLGIEDRGGSKEQLSLQDHALLDELFAEHGDEVAEAGGEELAAHETWAEGSSEPDAELDGVDD